MVNLTRIYTRTGDDGTTGYGGRGRISKNDPRLEAYADCDEAGAFLGVALASGALTDDVAAGFVHAVAKRLPRLELDYVRLNIRGRRAS